MEYEGQFVSNKDGEDLERQYATVMFLDIFFMRISLLFTLRRMNQWLMEYSTVISTLSRKHGLNMMSYFYIGNLNIELF